jgi:hypothetical protein
MAHATPRPKCHEMKPLAAKASQLHQQVVTVGAGETKRKETGSHEKSYKKKGGEKKRRK